MAMNPGNNPDYDRATCICDFKVKSMNGEYISLDRYRDHVCIIVNVASQCSLAPVHYTQFNEMMEKYGESKGLRILAFPCDQFTADNTTADNEYKFDIFGKVDVNGESASPLWKYLKLKKSSGKGDFIKWNFTKFLINKRGVPVDRYDCNIQPSQMMGFIESYW